MAIFIFQSVKEPEVFGFTEDQTGSNLPGQFVPWHSGDGQAIEALDLLAGFGGSDVVSAGISANGHYLARVNSSSHAALMPKRLCDPTSCRSHRRAGDGGA
jgi:hypothetical protein